MGKFTRANRAAERSGIAPEPSAATLAARRFATIAVMVATAMQAADTTIVNVGLPQLSGRAFGAMCRHRGSWRWEFEHNQAGGILGSWGLRHPAPAETQTHPHQAIEFNGILLLHAGIRTLPLRLARKVTVAWLRA